MTNLLQPAETSKKIYPGLHLIRCLACLMVIAVHIACRDFYPFAEGWWASNLYDGFSRAAVPMFFMMTGFLLLEEREMSLWEFYKKRFLAIIPYFLLVFLAHYLYANRPLNMEFFSALLSDRSAPHFWYIYVLIGIYLALPYFKRIYRHATQQEINFFLFMWVATQCVLSVVETGLKTDYRIEATFNLSFFLGYMGYVVLGAKLKHITYPPTMPTWGKVALCVFATSLTLIGTYILSAKAGKGDELLYQYISPTVLFQSVALFMLLKDITYSNRLIVSISKCTYLIYLIHLLVLEWFQSTQIGAIHLSPWFKTPYLALCTFVLSYLISLGIQTTVGSTFALFGRLTARYSLLQK